MLITQSADAHLNSGRDEPSARSINNTAPLQCRSDRLPLALQCLKYLERLTSNEYINFNCACISSRSVQAASVQRKRCRSSGLTCKERTLTKSSRSHMVVLYWTIALEYLCTHPVWTSALPSFVLIKDEPAVQKTFKHVQCAFKYCIMSAWSRLDCDMVLLFRDLFKFYFETQTNYGEMKCCCFH